MADTETRNKRIAVIAGDGIGREVIPAAIEILEAAATRFGMALEFTDFLVVERDVDIGLAVVDEPVVRDDLDALLVRLVDDLRSRVRVDRVEYEHLGAVGDRGVCLLLLRGRELAAIYPSCR